MNNASKQIVFLDSSILISSKIRRDLTSKIKNWLANYRLKVTGTVAIQEFKNRVLRDCAYLLTVLNKTKSYQRTLDHITSVLPQQQQRKKAICLPILHSVIPGPQTDDELTERTRLYLHTLLVSGLPALRSEFDSILTGVDCHWSKAPVIVKKKYSTYEIGERYCSKSKGTCSIASVLNSKLELCQGLSNFLNNLPVERKTRELQSAAIFLQKFLNGELSPNLNDEEPCQKFGDLLLAIESEGIPDFYTMNYRESQAYCDFLEQCLTVRPNNPINNEICHNATSKPWPIP